MVRQLANGLARRGVDVNVVAVLDPSDVNGHPLVEALREDGITTHILMAASRAYWREQAQVATLLRMTGADILHTHGYRCDVVDGPVARRLNRRHVVTLHGFTGRDWRGHLYEWLQVRSVANADAVVAVSTPIARRVLQADGGARVHVLRNAIDPSIEVPEREMARRLLGLATGRFSVGWIGRISHEKGLDLLIEAMVPLKGRAHATVVGDGPMRGEMADMVTALGLQDTVYFAGMQPDARRLLKAFDALALTSRTEGTPMVLLEAMAAGVPVVATAVGGIPDIVDGQSAWLSIPDPASISASIESVMTGGAGNLRRTAHALDLVETNHNMQRWVDQHLEIYRGVASHGIDHECDTGRTD